MPIDKIEFDVVLIYDTLIKFLKLHVIENSFEFSTFLLHSERL